MHLGKRARIGLLCQYYKYLETYLKCTEKKSCISRILIIGGEGGIIRLACGETNDASGVGLQKLSSGSLRSLQNFFACSFELRSGADIKKNPA